MVTSSYSRMRVMNHNWSATKQRLHPQSVAEISRHSVLSGTGFDNVRHRLGLATRTQIRIRQCETSSGSRHKDTDQDSTMWDIAWVSPQGHRSGFDNVRHRLGLATRTQIRIRQCETSPGSRHKDTDQDSTMWMVTKWSFTKFSGKSRHVEEKLISWP